MEKQWVDSNLSAKILSSPEPRSGPLSIIHFRIDDSPEADWLFTTVKFSVSWVGFVNFYKLQLESLHFSTWAIRRNNDTRRLSIEISRCFVIVQVSWCLSPHCSSVSSGLVDNSWISPGTSQYVSVHERPGYIQYSSSQRERERESRNLDHTTLPTNHWMPSGPIFGYIRMFFFRCNESGIMWTF